MSILCRSLVPRQIGNAYRCISIAQAKSHYWYPDLKPGPYPRTKEEREAAAKKYNLLPEEYEPYSEDTDEALGDYPKLPFESVDSKDPWYPWDHKELRRNFGEAVPLRMMNLLPETTSTGPLPISHAKASIIFITMVLSAITLGCLVDKVRIITPVMEQQLVTPGVTHYTFNIDKEGRSRKKGKSTHDKEHHKEHDKAHHKASGK